MIRELSVVQGLGSAPLRAEGLQLGDRVGAPLANTDPSAGLDAGGTQNCRLEGLTASQRTHGCHDREEMGLRREGQWVGVGRREGALPDPQQDGTKGKLSPFTLGVAMEKVA